MHQYLLNIAARNTGNLTNELLPSKPVSVAADNGISQGFNEEIDMQNNTLQNQDLPQSIFPAAPILPIQAQQAPVLHENETTSGLTPKNTETTYFSKHIERVESVLENKPLKNKTDETVSFKMDGSEQQDIVKNAGDQLHVNDPVFVHTIVSKIVPEKKGANKQIAEKANKKSTANNQNETVDKDEIIFKEKQILQPAEIKTEFQDNKIIIQEKIRTERIFPNQTEPLHEKQLQNSKRNEAVPKLVIGRITVEILPPKLPAPQKIISKGLQSPAKDSYAKSNKLIFGLGQL